MPLYKLRLAFYCVYSIFNKKIDKYSINVKLTRQFLELSENIEKKLSENSFQWDFFSNFSTVQENENRELKIKTE